MARAISVLLGLACLGAAAVIAYSAAAGPEPSVPPGVYPDEAVLDFGELAQGDVRHGQFGLANRHPEPIEVLDVATGCSCTESVLSARQIPSGERFTLDIKWSVGTRRGQLVDAVHMMYRTVAGGQHIVDLRLTANVTPDIHYTPDTLRFEPDRPGSAVVRFTPGRRDPFVLKQASTTQTAFRAVLETAKAEVTVMFDPAAWIDIGSDPVLAVYTDSACQPLIQIPLRVARPAPRAGPSSSAGF